MNLSKFFILILISFLATSCVDGSGEQVAHKSKTGKAFDVLGEFDGENELEYNKYVNGKFITDDHPKNSSRKSSKFLNESNIDIHYAEEGVASFYAHKFQGRKTANGATYDRYQYTAAHLTLPMPSVARVVNLENQRSVLVVITDRGPYHSAKGKNRRIIDLSHRAAKELGILAKGIAKVKVQYLHEETKELLSKFPEEEKTKANLAFQAALTKHVAQVNSKVSRKRL